MPALAVLAAPAQVGDGQDAAPVQPDEARRAEGRGQIDVEAAVAVEQGGPRAVPGKALLVDQEHRDLGAVLRDIEDPFHLVG